MIDPADIVDAARAMVGTPYRRLGRKPGVGLDCAGLIVAVGAAFSLSIHSPDVYRMSQLFDAVYRWARASGLEEMGREWSAGAVVLLDHGTHTHVAIATLDGRIEARNEMPDRQVVEIGCRQEDALAATFGFPGVRYG